MTSRQMALVAFMQAGSTSVYAGSWRHPATEHGYLDASYYAKIGRQLEEGCFDLMFFDDRLAMPGIYGGSVADAVKYGARPVKLDLSIVLGVLAQATSHIGLGATGSTTYYTPFHIARTFATLDHLSGGRAAWNIVTSVNGIYADPDKVHELHHAGEYFSVRGPLTVPRSPQGRPVLIQAGSSGRGREFASRWADLIFTGDPGIEVARNHYADQKERIEAAGRDPQSVKLCPMAYAVVGESEDHAKEREQVFLNDLVHPMASLTLLSELMNYDFSKHDLDDPITDELIESVSGIRGLVQNLRAHIGDKITLRDLAGHRATLLQGPRFVGTGTQVADQMEEWFNGGACDGFVLAATHLPGAFEDVVRMVVPQLQRRGLFRTAYESSTLRGHLGLQRPSDSRVPGGAGVEMESELDGVRVARLATLGPAAAVATYLGEFG